MVIYGRWHLWIKATRWGIYPTRVRRLKPCFCPEIVLKSATVPWGVSAGSKWLQRPRGWFFSIEGTGCFTLGFTCSELSPSTFLTQWVYKKLRLWDDDENIQNEPPTRLVAGRVSLVLASPPDCCGKLSGQIAFLVAGDVDLWNAKQPDVCSGTGSLWQKALRLLWKSVYWRILREWDRLQLSLLCHILADHTSFLLYWHWCQ